MKRKIILVTGGQRSGKSRYAQELALRLAEDPVYLATSRVWDDEFRERVRRHQLDRGPQWTNLEEEKWIGKCDVRGRVVVIDCVTLRSTNFFLDNDSNVDKSLQEIKSEFDRFVEQEATFIFVTNEIGMGGIAVDPVQRRFTDLQGWVNQYIGSKANEVILMVSGIALSVKNE